MRRRTFITLLGGAAAAWPLAARAQQQPRAPTIGFLHSASADGSADRVRAFRQGLKEAGLIEGENVTAEYRWAAQEVERLPALANELVRHGVVAIAAMGPAATFAAKAATTAIPIVFVVPEDPVRLGLVTTLARPGGNLTGVNFFPAEVSAKRLALLRELVPQALRIAVLADPNNPSAERHCETSKPPPVRRGCKFRCSRSAPAAKSMQRLPASGASAPMRYLPMSPLYSWTAASSWHSRRCCTGSPRRFTCVNLPRRVG